jgi:hypothetical protein
MIDYGNLLRRAWEICWQNRWLFVLGILATLGSASAGGGNAFSYSFGGEDVGPEFERQAAEFLRGLVAAWPYLVAGAIVLAVMGLLLWLLRLAARGGLIAAADALDAEAGVEKGPVSLRAALRRGGRHLPRLIGLDAVLYGPILLITVVPVAFFLMVGSGVAIAILEGRSFEALAPSFLETVVIAATCLCVLGCIVFLWQVFLAFLHPLAQRSVVLADRRVFAAIRHGWQILGGHAGEMILLVLLLFVVGLVFRALLAAVLVPVALLLFVPSILELIRGGAPSMGQLAGIVLASIGLALVAQVLNGLYVTYQSVSYTLGYRQMTRPNAVIPASSLPPSTPYQFEPPSEE